MLAAGRRGVTIVLRDGRKHFLLLDPEDAHALLKVRPLTRS